MRVPAHHGVRCKITQVLDSAWIMHKCDGRLVRGHVGEGPVRSEVTYPQIAQSHEPQRVAVNVQNGRLVPQDGDPAVGHAPGKAIQQVVPPAPEAVIVIAQTGIGAESTFDVAEQGDDFFPVRTGKVIRDVISRQYDEIDVEQVDPFDATTQIRAAHGPAVMKVADMRYALAIQATMRALERQIDFDNFDPLRADSVGIDRPSRTNTQQSQSGTLQIVPAID